MTTEDLVSIVSNFKIDDTIVEVKPFGNGHIHQTFKVIGRQENYLLQQINKDIFSNSEALMNNIYLVLEHLQEHGRLSHKLRLISTRDGKRFLRKDSSHWRIFNFFDDLVAYENVKRPELVYEGAKAFASFVGDLRFLDARKCYTSLPDFNNLFHRLDQLDTAIKNGNQSRIILAKTVIKAFQEAADEQCELERRKMAGQFPNRICHNDTKLNNVLFDHQGNGACVIDLDTIMPGIVHYDYGDGIRTACATAEEDEPDLANVGFDEEKLRAFHEGYMSVAADFLLPVEVESLRLAIPVFPFLTGVRFLTDFLNGDTYYKTKYADHNFVRAKNQLKLFQEALKYVKVS